MRRLKTFSAAMAICVFLGGAAANDEPSSLIGNGDFDAPGATIKPWMPFVHGKSDAALTVADGEGVRGSPCARYRRTTAGSDNVHLDQIVPVKKNVIYEVRASMRADGRLNPLLAVMSFDWRPLPIAPSNAGKDWTEVRLVFLSTEDQRVRIEWFPGSDGKPYVGRPGTSWLDDVSTRSLANPSPALVRGLALGSSKAGREIDTHAVKTGPVGKPVPGRLRPITCRNGVLVYDDGTEVALWGVNFQTALAWEYNGRLKPLGIPREASSLKRISDENFDEIRAMGAGVIRLHLCPADFSDAEGNLRESPYLDVLDYLLAKCHQTGTYVYLTLVNDMRTRTFPDSFINTRERREWLFDPDFIAKTEHYVKAILSHENRYTGRRFAEDPAIAVIEIMNEPDYLSWSELGGEKGLAEYRAAFDAWRARHAADDPPQGDCPSLADGENAAVPLEVAFSLWRYQTVRDYLDHMCSAIRSTGARQPIAWNLNWPQMIAGHEDVFQAVAESPVDGVSFCLYPGQQDVPNPFWQHPVNLDGKNYLPFLAQNYLDYQRLRWVLGKRFADKAKLVYEFETFYTQNSFLYPAMARLMRALGVQIAPMWTYSLTPSAQYLSGSHYLSFYCTPQKAASFAIAAEVFGRTPRFAAYDTAATEEMTFDGCHLCAPKNISVLQTPNTLMHSRSLEELPFGPGAGVRRILACGGSPLVEYGGSGIYRVDVSDTAVDVTINPDAKFVRPHWEAFRSKHPEKSCDLDPQARHRFALNLPGWQQGVSVFRIEGDRKLPVANPGGAACFEAQPGHYRIERKLK